MPVINPKVAIPALLSLALLGCSREGELTQLGIITSRSACPDVAIPAATGDITLFNPETSRDASAIDVVANMTNVRSTCDETGVNIVTNVTFDVYAQRRNPAGAREVVIPYFATVVQGGSNVVSKRVGRVALRFADGEYRASTSGAATGQVLPATGFNIGAARNINGTFVLGLLARFLEANTDANVLVSGEHGTGKEVVAQWLHSASPRAAQQPVLALESPGPPERAAELHLGANGGEQPVVVPGLLDEVTGAASHGLDRLLHAAPRGHHHGRQGGVQGLKLGDQLQPFAAGGGIAGVVEVEQHGIEVGGLSRGEHAGRGGGGVDRVALALQQQPQRLADVGLVVRDEHVSWRGCGRGRHGVRM